MTASPPPSETTLVRRLGGGATFEASVARDSRGGIFVVKRPLPQLRERPEGDLALDREWEVLSAFAGLTLPYLPRPLFRGEDAAGPYLAETFIAGISLRDLRLGAERALSTRRLGVIARAASSALAELHAYRDERGPLGFVHGDIAPDNLIFEERSETVSFLDFATSTFRDAPHPVFPGSMGTLPYVAPELARGEVAPSAKTDTYALAATLASLITVAPLTESSGGAPLLLEVAERGLHLDALRGRSPASLCLRDILADALAFDPQGRLCDSRELALKLSAALDL